MGSGSSTNGFNIDPLQDISKQEYDRIVQEYADRSSERRDSLRSDIGHRASTNASRRSSFIERNAICDFRGVCLDWFVEFAKKVQSGVEGSGVDLVVIEKDLRVDLREKEISLQGWTARVLPKKGQQGPDQIRLAIPYIGQIVTEKENVREKPRKDWDTEDVCEYIVKGNSFLMEKELFYNDVIEKEHGTNNKVLGKPFEGAFLSQARRTKFIDLVEAVILYYEKHPKRKRYIWLDMFAANQPKLCDPNSPPEVQEEREEMLSSGLHMAISRFDNFLVFFDCWDTPLPLTRAWCVWELYGCIKFRYANETNYELPFDIVFSHSERDRFVNGALLGNYESIMGNISKIDVRNAGCFKKEDKIMIDGEITKNVGHDRLNALVSEALHKWCAQAALQVVDEWKQIPDTRDHDAFSALLVNSGMLLRGQGRLGEALALYQLALVEAGTTPSRSPNSALLAQIRTNIANVYLQQGDVDRAFEMFEDALKIHSHPETLNGLAIIYEKRGDLTRAVETYKQALSLYEASKNTIKAAETLNNIGICFRSQNNDPAALEAFTLALSIQKGKLGETHPSVAVSLNNIAMVLRKRGEKEKALEYFLKALEIQREKLGERNMTIAMTLTNCALVQEELGDLHLALRNHGLVLEIKRTLGVPNATPITLYYMACIYEKTDNLEKAVECYEGAISLLDRTSMEYAVYKGNLGLLYQTQNKLKKAQFCLEDAVELKMGVFGESHLKVGETLFNLALVYDGNKLYQQALEKAQSALTIFNETLQRDDHPYIQSCDAVIKQLEQKISKLSLK